MEVGIATDFLEDAMFDDNFTCKCLDWYKNDNYIILSDMELSELHTALNEWVENNNIVKVQTVARINHLIGEFLKKKENKDT